MITKKKLSKIKRLKKRKLKLQREIVSINQKIEKISVQLFTLLVRNK